MPGSFVIDVARRCVSSRGRGLMVSEDLLDHVAQLRGHPAFDPTFDQCMDHLGVTQVDADSAVVRGIATLNPFRPPARRASA